MKKTLWTRDFTIIILGTIISAIGGVALNFAMTIVIYSETSSTMLTGIYGAVTMIPQVLLPIFVAPYVDKLSRKKIIYSLDFLMGAMYILFTFYIKAFGFSYYVFMAAGVSSSFISVIYSQAYESLFPDLIPEGFAQKGYSVATLIYPSISTVITPIAALIYHNLGVEVIFLLEGILLIIAAVFEMGIKMEEKKREAVVYTFKKYIEDLKEGLLYLKEEKGIRCIFIYMTFMIFSSQGIGLLFVPFFATHLIYTTTNYSLLISADTLGRMIGGFLHYIIKIPTEKRYAIASKVYVIYEILEGSIMFVAFPIMLVIKVILGFLGVNSANIRQSSVQNYIPSNKRARVNSFSQILTFGGMIVAQLLAGALGEVMDYKYAGLCFMMVPLIAIYFCIIKNKEEIKKIYNRDI